MEDFVSHNNQKYKSDGREFRDVGFEDVGLESGGRKICGRKEKSVETDEDRFKPAGCVLRQQTDAENSDDQIGREIRTSVICYP